MQRSPLAKGRLSLQVGDSDCISPERTSLTQHLPHQGHLALEVELGISTVPAKQSPNSHLGWLTREIEENSPVERLKSALDPNQQSLFFLGDLVNCLRHIF